MARTFNQIVAAVLQKVEDPNNTIYSTTETYEAVNEAKDDVVDVIKSANANVLMNSTTLAFVANDREMNLGSSSFLEISHIETGDPPTRHQVLDFRDKEFDYSMAGDGFYLYSDATGQDIIGRSNPAPALTATVVYRNDFDDQTASGAGWPFPKIADDLLIIKAVILLSLSRKREVNYWINRENRLEEKVIERLQNRNRTSSRRVIYKG